MGNLKVLFQDLLSNSYDRNFVLAISLGVAVVICWKVFRDLKYDGEAGNGRKVFIFTVILSAAALVWFLVAGMLPTHSIDPFWVYAFLPLPLGFVFGLFFFLIFFNRQARRTRRRLIRKIRKFRQRRLL